MYLYRDPEGQSWEDWGQGGLEKRCMDAFMVVIME